MSDEKALTPVDQRTVFFYDDELTAVRVKDGTIYVPIRPICDNLGIALAGQRERINRDPVLSEAVTSVSVTLTQQAREMLCLPLRFIPGTAAFMASYTGAIAFRPTGSCRPQSMTTPSNGWGNGFKT